MARSDVSILKEFMSETILAIENILKYKNVKGLKSLVMELNSLGTIGLEAIDKHIESILNLTKKKDLAQWTENVMINNKEKSDNKLAMAHARFAAFTKSTAKHDLFSRNEIDLLSKPKTTTDKVREIIEKNGLSVGKRNVYRKTKLPRRRTHHVDPRQLQNLLTSQAYQVKQALTK